MVHQEVCDDIAAFAASPGLHRHPGVPVVHHRRRRQYRILHRRAPWLSLSVSSSTMSAIAATASRFAGGESVYVPYTLGGETVEVEPVAGHPDRRQLATHRARQRRADRTVLPLFRQPAAAAPSSIGRRTPIAPGSGRSWSTRSTHAGIDCEVDELIDAHGAGRRRITVHARRGSDGELRVGFAAAGSHAIVAIDDCPILDPALARRARGRARARRGAEADRQAARHPDHGGDMPASTSMCAAPGRCRPR